ncbi:AI-2E family transporter [Flavobacteriaceae bacterium]|nr:AI-2E family transporter [Flavobacteriaceae bacterium]
MNENQIAKGIVRAILYLTLIGLGLYAIHLLSSLIVFIAIAAITSLIGRPITVFLKQKLKFGNTIAVVSTMSILVLLLFGVISLFVPLIIQQGENLSLLDVNALEMKINKLFEEIAIYFNWQETNWKNWLLEKDWMNTLNLKVLPEFLNSLLGWVSGFTIALFSILFISFFLLKDAQLMERTVLLLFDAKNHKRLQDSFEKIKNLLSRYFIGLLLQISILFIIYSIVLVVFGVKNALIIAFLCALLNLIPYVGPLIGGVLMLLLTMTANLEADFSSVTLPKSIYVMFGFVLGQLVDNFFSQPYIFSTSVKSHPLEIFIVILMAGILFGTIGLIVAIPCYTALKVIFKEFYADNKIVQSLTKDL